MWGTCNASCLKRRWLSKHVSVLYDDAHDLVTRCALQSFIRSESLGLVETQVERGALNRWAVLKEM